MSITKQQFKNNTEGYVGAVVIGPKGDDRGIPVEPGGFVWLSEAEQTLTANAPRQAKDNPFVPQTFTRTDPTTGVTEEVEVTPLTPVDEGRFVPAGMRYVPGVDADGARGDAAAMAAATADEPTVIAEQPSVVQRNEDVLAMGEDAKPGHPPPPPKAAKAVEKSAPPSAPPADETAAKADPKVKEETGAAVAPQAPQPKGSFTAKEEVGTPDAPKLKPAAPAKE